MLFTNLTINNSLTLFRESQPMYFNNPVWKFSIYFDSPSEDYLTTRTIAVNAGPVQVPPHFSRAIELNRLDLEMGELEFFYVNLTTEVN